MSFVLFLFVHKLLYGLGFIWGGKLKISDTVSDTDQIQNGIIEQIVELQREFYFENKGKETERRRRLRDIIDRATSSKDS
jgi:hypothetical protein